VKPVELVAVFVRFFAATLVLGDLTLILQMAETIRRLSLFPTEPLNRPVFLTDAAVVVVVFASAVLFWLFPFPIARFFVPKGVESELAIGFSAEQLEVCLLSLLGVSVLITALPQTIRLLIRMAAVQLTPEDPPGQRWAYLAFWLVQIALGALLLLRSVGIRRVVHGLRTKGT
jgi:hypothetical protein